MLIQNDFFDQIKNILMNFRINKIYIPKNDVVYKLVILGC